MATSFCDWCKHYIKVVRTGCVYQKNKNDWACTCGLDGSRRGRLCYKECPKCKLLFKDRLKAAWHVLTWDERYIR